jgi:hypothetical protein
MRQQAAMPVAPSAQKDERVVVRCENPDCKLNQFMTKNGLCRNRNCKWKLPSGGAAWVAPFVPRPKSATIAMQLALGEQLKENKEEPF